MPRMRRRPRIINLGRRNTEDVEAVIDLSTGFRTRYRVAELSAAIIKIFVSPGGPRKIARSTQIGGLPAASPAVNLYSIEGWEKFLANPHSRFFSSFRNAQATGYKNARPIRKNNRPPLEWSGPEMTDLSRYR